MPLPWPVVVLGTVCLAAPAAAQQQLSLNIGYFALRGEGSRVAGDTIVENLWADYPFALGYQVSDFNNVTFGAEWLFPLGQFLEGGIGVSYYQKHGAQLLRRPGGQRYRPRHHCRI